MSTSLRHYKAALFGALLTLIGAPTSGMDFGFRPVTFDGGSEVMTINALVASGQIRHGDAQRLHEFLAVPANASKYYSANGGAGQNILVDSTGGDVEEAIRLAQVLREILATVIAKPPMICASSCFFLYVGAAKRGGWFGRALAVHRPFFAADVTRSLSLAQAEEAHRAAFAIAKRWLQDQLVPQALIDRMFSLPSTQAYWLTAGDVEQLGNRAPWYEEWLLARCPDFVDVEQRFFATAHGTIGAHDEALRAFRVELNCQANATDLEVATVLRRYINK